MSEELSDEITSINAICGDNTLQFLEESIYALVLPSAPSISLRLEFSRDYPDTPPSILGPQHIGEDVAQGEGHDLVDLARKILAQVYQPGQPCLFDVIEEAGQALQQLGLDVQSRDAAEQAAQADRKTSSSPPLGTSSDGVQSLSELQEPPPWTLSEAVTEKKSIFVARAALVTTVEEAQQYVFHLLNTDKKVAKATHNITAWRIRGANGVQFQDCDDDGETAAGGRSLHLLELMDVWNVMVVVTRWYGGVQLGPDRFRIINQTARDAVLKGGFAEVAAKEVKGGGKKKGKR